MAFGGGIAEVLREIREIYRCRRGYQSFAGIRNGDRFDYLSFPTTLWGTKSHAFWVLLALMLHKLRPNSLLELGSGRSTIYLSEYAGKNGAQLVSIDQNASWVALNKLTCRFGGHDEAFLHLVDLQEDGFYAVEQLRQLVGPADFVFIDGPTQRGTTRSQMAWLTEAVSTARVIIIDDVHRRHIFDQIAPLAAAANCHHRMFLEYSYHDRADYLSCLCILADDAAFPVIADAARYIDAPVTAAYSEQDCPAD